MTERIDYFVGIGAACVTAMVYAAALKNGFVTWDDYQYVVNNNRIAPFDFAFISWAFTTFRAANYHPLTWISLGMDRLIWGSGPWGYHFTNILLHALNTFLVVVLMSRLLNPGDAKLAPSRPGMKTLIAAGVTALLFGIHPLHVESVAWISERKDVLYVFFALLMVLAYLQYTARQVGRVPWYAASLILYLFALLSKSMAVTLPLVLLLLDAFPLRRFSTSEPAEVKFILMEKLPFVGLSAAFSLAAISTQLHGNSVAAIESLYPAERVLLALRAIIFYLNKFVVPVDLAPFYPIQTPVLFSGADAVGVIIVTAISLVGIIAWRTNRAWLTAWAFYLITLLPVLGLVQVGSQAAADRYTYLALLGPMALVGLGIASLGERIFQREHTSRYIVMGVAVVLLISLSGILISLTVRQIGIWRDSLTLWNYELATYPDNDPIVYRARAEAYFLLGNYDLALADLTRAIQINPSDFRTYTERGRVHQAQGQNDKAIVDYNMALWINPGDSRAIYFRALVPKAP